MPLTPPRESGLSCCCGGIEWEDIGSTPHVCSGRLLDYWQNGRLQFPPQGRKKFIEREYVGLILPKLQISTQKSYFSKFLLPVHEIKEKSLLSIEASKIIAAKIPEMKSRVEITSENDQIIPEYSGKNGESFIQSAKRGASIFNREYGEETFIPSSAESFYEYQSVCDWSSIEDPEESFENMSSTGMSGEEFISPCFSITPQEENQEWDWDWTPFESKNFLQYMFPFPTHRFEI